MAPQFNSENAVCGHRSNIIFQPAKMEKSMISFVCTTINPDAPFLRDNIEKFQSAGLHSYIVLDRKVLSTKDAPFINFRDRPLNEYERICDWDSYSRKNIGYIRASKTSEYIFETDDDNALIIDPLSMPSDLQPVAPRRGGVIISNTSNLFSKIYNWNTAIWARGLPMSYRDVEPIESAVENLADFEKKCGVVQYLVQGNPDVDAIFRLVNGPDCVVELTDSYSDIYLQGAMHPFNSQGTLWKKEYFALMYLPAFCEFRMTDIWRGYIAQAVIYKQGGSIKFTRPGLFQERNPHDIYDDFKGEYDGYKQSDLVLRIVQETSASHIKDQMIEIYKNLIKNGVISSRKELVLLDEFLNEIECG
jgi:hypothetical protein